MAKITIPKTACMVTEPPTQLYMWYYNIVTFDEQKNRTLSGDNVIIEGSFDLTIAEIELILANGGTIEEMLTAIRVANWTTFKALSVPVGIQQSSDIFSTGQLTFANWLRRGEVWHKLIEAIQNGIFYTNMNGQDAQKYLTGAEIKILVDMAEATHMTLADANALIIADSWPKYE